VGSGRDAHPALAVPADLPPPVARYFRRVLQPGQASIRSARLTQSGTLRTGPKSWRWMPFEATQEVSPEETTFNWDARVCVAPFLSLRVRDGLFEGRGGGRVDLWSAIKLAADADTPELNAGALHRYLAEAVWYPTALLPGPQLAWTPIDERKALATLTSYRTTVSLEFHFNHEGEVAAIYTPQRWARSGRKYVQLPWEGHFFGYWECSGMLVPAAGEVGWHVDGKWQAVWKGRVTFASYELER
jgi:hypothetical protein